MKIGFVLLLGATALVVAVSGARAEPGIACGTSAPRQVLPSQDIRAQRAHDIRLLH